MQITTHEVLKGGREQSSIIQSTQFVVPDKILKPRNSGRKREKGSWVRTLIPIFQKNETARQDDKMTDTHIKAWILEKYGGIRTVYKNVKNYNYTVGLFRGWYNKSELTTNQPTPILISLSYDTDGYPIVGAYRGRSWKHYLYFEEAYHKCAMLKIADPRFVEYEKIVEIRNRLVQKDPDWEDWYVPTEDQLKDIARSLGVRKIENIYNSISFPPGYTREETPHDFVPFKYYDDLMSDLP